MDGRKLKYINYIIQLAQVHINVEIGILSAWQLSFSKKSANSRPVLSIRSNAEVSGAEKCNLS